MHVKRRTGPSFHQGRHSPRTVRRNPNESCGSFCVWEDLEPTNSQNAVTVCSGNEKANVSLSVALRQVTHSQPSAILAYHCAADFSLSTRPAKRFASAMFCRSRRCPWPTPTFSWPVHARRVSTACDAFVVAPACPWCWQRRRSTFGGSGFWASLDGFVSQVPESFHVKTVA